MKRSRRELAVGMVIHRVSENITRLRFFPVLIFTLSTKIKKNYTVCVFTVGNAIPFLGVKPKRGWYVLSLFFKVGICSAISF